ncbi:hypothetical protein Q8A67_023179 [Cirrhinus molitorella]|uniref:Uncharacterized protein n=1 Tax=Cirrhinus molitorella TaxID=172907 RepID=A0AA88TCD9_9TELE|nr:hypothetical protein Q8A67_023179 [Cirrhinus molitorella]
MEKKKSGRKSPVEISQWQGSESLSGGTSLTDRIPSAAIVIQESVPSRPLVPASFVPHLSREFCGCLTDFPAACLVCFLLHALLQDYLPSERRSAAEALIILRSDSYFRVVESERAAPRIPPNGPFFTSGPHAGRLMELAAMQQESKRCGHVTLISRAAHRALEAVFGGHSAAPPASGLLSANGPPLCVSGAGREEGPLGSRLSCRDQLLLLLSLHKVSGAEGPSQAQGESNTLFLSVHRRPAVSVE